ncbi:MAG TPA: hypothetical protein VFJ97_12250 [Dermatophilaceae bacterium]|nr:hypothetical protein [Dermatophilaceae bacterium]
MAVVALATVTSSTAFAAGGSRVEARGNVTFEPNQRIEDTLQWHGGELSVKSGERLTIVSNDELPGEPHVFTIVRAQEQPQTLDELGVSCGTCQDALAAHDPDGNGLPPFTLVVNKGKPGIDTVGDSFILFDGATITPRVTAKPGTTLFFICSIHNEMQGVLHVTS